MTLVRVKPVLGMAIGEMNSVYGSRISIDLYIGIKRAWGMG